MLKKSPNKALNLNKRAHGFRVLASLVMQRIVIMNRSQMDELMQLLQKYELSIATLYETFADVFTGRVLPDS
jgi:hypothetical protein